MVDQRTVLRIGAIAAGAGVAFVAGLVLFGIVPSLTPIGALEMVLILLTVLVGAYVTNKVAGGLLTDYDVAKVAVDGPISNDSGGPVPIRSGDATAEEITEKIRRADEDGDAEALVVELDTPGGMPVASDDIREAVEEFDGPTFAYSKDLCASGGMFVACGCDEFFARDNGIVGSIGVNANQTKFTGFADEYGISREQFTGGEYKDTFDPLKDLSEDEREYFQGVIDAGYDSFVELVAESRDLDEQTVRDTEARVYFAEDALEMGLVDHVGGPAEFEDLVATRLGKDEIEVEPFEPDTGFADKLSIGAQRAAYAFGHGLASVVADRDGAVIEYRR
jgi:protease-4